MWTVDKPVDKFEGKNVYSTYPQFCERRERFKGLFIHGKIKVVLAG